MRMRGFCVFALLCAALSAVAADPVSRRLVRGDVALYCGENDLKNGERIVSIIEAEIPRIAAVVGLTRPESLTVFLAGTRSEFRAMTGNEVPDWSGGAADADRAVLFLQSPRFADPDGRLDRVVVHELSHAVLGMALDGKRADRWFEEGFAMFESGESGFGGTVQLMWNFLLGHSIPLSDLENVLAFDREKAALAYEESASAVKFLVECSGTGGIGALVSVLRGGGTMEEAVAAASGLGIREFEAEWSKSVKRRSRSALLIDGSISLSLVFTVLFFAALLATRIRTRRIQKEWEQRREQDPQNEIEKNPPPD